ncbi:unnamed protein product [Phytomonas sp. EM1]|nr:unnamed protein product [Phytomonas sp. EM1]|eukprot:CCW64221.1 unnamed protein product [Phytomonas sp. isolate EM1]
MYSVTRAVARGEGDWAEVPYNVREAIVHTLSHPDSVSDAHPMPDGPRLTHSSSSHKSQQLLLPTLSERDVQCSIDTFEDGLWVRDQAVRCYARFHNSVEALYREARGQLRPLWRTAMQLRSDYLEGVRKQLGLLPSDSIPEGVPIPQHYAERTAHEEMILESMLQNLQQLRDASVRFAAHWLTDDEKIAMGTNPVYLQAEAIGEGTPRSYNQQMKSPRSLLEKPGARRPSHRVSLPANASSCGKSTAIDEGLTMGDPKLMSLLQQYAERLAEISERGDKVSSHNRDKHKH